MNLVLGFAVGYSPEVMAPFVESIRSAGQFAGEVALFIDPAIPGATEYLKTRQIKPIPFEGAKLSNANIGLARCFSYLSYMREHWREGKVFQQILLTDVRDVVFQRALFGTPCDELEFHLEEPYPSIGACPYNALWIQQAFGDAVLERVADKNISCSGTVTGRASGIVNYLTQMTYLAERLPEHLRQVQGIDQGLHNYILYGGLPQSLTVKKNFERVATLGYAKGDEIRCDAAGCIVNPDGTISELAHQWDRHVGLSTTLHAIAHRRRLLSEVSFLVQDEMPDASQTLSG